MAGSWFAQFMISSIKSNSRRTRHTSFDKNKLLNNISKKKKSKLVFKKATQQQLFKIRNQLQKSNQVYQYKVIFFTSVFIIFISALLYYINNIITFIF
jgi:hypothetical protein